MEIIYRPRRMGKTTELIERASVGGYKIIVCHSRQEADRIFDLATKMGRQIPLPITYEDFIKHSFYGKNIKSFLIDNVDMLITYMSNGVEVEAITLSKEI